MTKKTKKNKKNLKPLSKKRKTIFYAITFSIPILFFLILEIFLRSINYLGNTDLFIDPNVPDKEFLMPNPNFAGRYFFYTKTIPNPSIDVFQKEKPENGFRVFAMGGSSAAGYPYGFNGTYSRVVRDVLQDAMPDREVEVVNVGISAISSYTLYDQVNELIEHEPDAILFYAGHNEFYGALGVGSNENLGAFPGFVRFYLKLQRFKTFMLLRTIIVDSGIWFSETFLGEKYDQTATLMERIVNSRSIELGSPQYELAMAQFESNLDAITKAFGEENIPVYIGSVASNLKDHSPFVNISNGEQPPAQTVFREAQQAYDSLDYQTALQKFTLAKDLDGLKFRAPSQINEIIRKSASSLDHVHYVPSEEELAENVEDGIIGFELMLEHLHPNQQGYFLIGKAFSETLLNELNISAAKDLDYYKSQMFFSELDHRVAWHRVATLKQSFPFVLGEKPTPYFRNYKHISKADSLAFKIVHSNKVWDLAKVELAEFYERQGQLDNAILEYMGLIRNQPWSLPPYVYVSRILLRMENYLAAEQILLKANEISPTDAYINKMLGSIQIQKENPFKAIRYLEAARRALPNDPQMLYNLSGAYYNSGKLEKAIEIANLGLEVSPNFPGLSEWRQQLEIVKNQRRRN